MFTVKFYLGLAVACAVSVAITQALELNAVLGAFVGLACGSFVPAVVDRVWR